MTRTAPPPLPPRVDPGLGLRLFRTMVLIRRCEEQLARAHQRGLVHGACHTYVGQEAIAAGVCEHLRTEDVVFSTHRGHGHALAKGVSPFELIDEVVLVGGSTRIPYVRRRVEEFFGRRPHTELNPDEVVALGAAVQADILTGGRRHMLLLDVVPLSLGIETLGGVVDKVIYRNTTVPARATTRYSTSIKGQTAILINIYQGERELTKDCKLLGTFKLSGIPPMPAQMPQVDVTFLVNENGMLTVRAREQRSGQEASVTVQAAHGLTQDEVDRLVLESVEHAHEDFTTARLIALKTDAERELRAFDQNLAPRHDLVPTDQWVAMEVARNALAAAAAGSDLQALVQAREQFNQVARPLAEAVMNQVVRATLSGKKEEDLGRGLG
jgi:molecular chaperone DnaK